MTYFRYVNKPKWQVISDAVLPALCLFSPLSWYWLFQLSVLQTTITASLCHQKGHRLQVVCARILLPNKHKVSRGNTNNDIICELISWAATCNSQRTSMFFSIAPSLLFSTQLSAYLEVHSFCVLHKFLIPLYKRWGRMYWRDDVSNISTKYKFSFGAKIHNWFGRHVKWPQNTIQCFFCTKSPAYCGCISKDCVSRSEEGKKSRVWGEYDAGQ